VAGIAAQHDVEFVPGVVLEVEDAFDGGEQVGPSEEARLAESTEGWVPRG
jgi:hypothetical protein